MRRSSSAFNNEHLIQFTRHHFHLRAIAGGWNGDICDGDDNDCDGGGDFFSLVPGYPRLQGDYTGHGKTPS